MKPYAALKEGLAMVVALDEDGVVNGNTGTTIDMPDEPGKPADQPQTDPQTGEIKPVAEIF